MKKTNKKGFTIVELVIVIAVIAILIAILIPTFSKIIGKANESSDTQIVRQLNTAIEIEGITAQNGKPTTMYDANEVTTEYGLNVEKLVAKSNFAIAWDSFNKRFVLLDEGANKYIFPIDSTKVDQGPIENKVDFFVVREKMADANGYSIYAGPAWTEPKISDLKVGFDVGNRNNDIKSIEYTGIDSENKEIDSKQGVIIRTNSYETSLTINAPEDVVNHLGIAGSVNIIKSHTQSYHEYGKVPFIEIAKGRIALEEGAEVTKLHFDAKTEEEFDDIIVAADPSVTLPEFSRDEVVIGDDGTLVVELQKDTKNDDNTESDYVYLYKQGVISQIVVTEEKVDGIHKNEDDGKFYGYTKDSTEVKTDVEEVKLGVTEKAKETQKAAVEIANNYTGNNTNGSITVGETEVELPILDKNGDLEVVAGVATADIAEKLGEGKTVEDVIKATVEKVAEAVEKVDNSKKPTELQGKTAEQIEVKEVKVAEGGLDAKDKELTKTTIIVEEEAKYNATLPACKVDGATYSSLDEAVADLANKTTASIVLEKDLTIIFGTENYISITKDQNVKIDLNGHKVKFISTRSSTSAVIKNCGTLTIEDSKADTATGIGKGHILVSSTDPDLKDVPGYASNLITNFGHLTINSGILENSTDDPGYAAYAVDNQACNADGQKTIDKKITLTINGGKLLSNTSVSIRMYLNSAGAYDNIISIKNAVVGSLWAQDNSGSSAAKGTITFENSEILNNVKFGYYNLCENMHVSAKNSKIREFIYAMPYAGKNSNVEITNCTFESFTMSDDAKILDVLSGTFGEDVCMYVKSDCISKQNGEMYEIIEKSKASPAEISAFNSSVESKSCVINTTTGVGYSTVTAAILNANNNETVKLIKDVVFDSYQTWNISTKITLDMNGHKLSGNYTSNANWFIESSSGTGSITFKNGTIDHVGSYSLLSEAAQFYLDNVVLTKGTTIYSGTGYKAAEYIGGTYSYTMVPAGVRNIGFYDPVNHKFSVTGVGTFSIDPTGLTDADLEYIMDYCGAASYELATEDFYSMDGYAHYIYCSYLNTNYPKTYSKYTFTKVDKQYCYNFSGAPYPSYIDEIETYLADGYVLEENGNNTVSIVKAEYIVQYQSSTYGTYVWGSYKTQAEADGQLEYFVTTYGPGTSYNSPYSEVVRAKFAFVYTYNGDDFIEWYFDNETDANEYLEEWISVNGSEYNARVIEWAVQD